MAAVISSVMNTKDKVPFFVNRCEEMGIEVLPPDVNSSDHGFVVSEKAIRFGLDAVKNVGHSAVEAILRAREDGADRLDLGLLRAGRLARRQQTGDRVPDQVRRPRLDRRHPQGHAGGAAGRPGGRPEGAGGRAARARARSSTSATTPTPAAPAPRPTTGRRSPPPSSTVAELLAMEKETLGTYLSSHPLAEVRGALRARVDCSLAELGGKPDGSWVTVGGIVADCKKIRTKSGIADDVRDPRRRRGPGRDARLQGRRGRERDGDRPRRGRPRPRPARPQGPRRDQAGGAGGRALRARRRRDRPRRQGRRRAPSGRSS